MRRSFVAVFCLFAAPALANEPPPKPEKNPPPAAPSALRGNDLPHCEPGRYPAGQFCKPAPPGYFAPANTRYPVPCPDGKSSSYGARGPGECS